ncbi:dynein light chain [Phytophthora cinnamomi]|uniref:dynein light chain n=1 Tax=Phytophthora cinnamomi TaxID=4785 RepID=UPI00355AC77F|nr:dynein light chain [Phytophthora cinnamomi]
MRGLMSPAPLRRTMASDLSTQRSAPQRSSDPHDDKGLVVLSAATWSGHAHGICIRLENHKELFVYAEHDVDASMWLDALKSI